MHLETTIISADSNVDKDGDDVHNVVYEVKYSTIHGPDFARLDTNNGLPRLWVDNYTSPFAPNGDSNPGAFCKYKRCRYREDADGNLTKKIFRCDVVFDSKLESNSKRDGLSAPDNPILKPWDTSLIAKTGTQSTNLDKDGNLVMNVVDEAKHVLIPSGTPIVRIQGNTDSLSFSIWAQSVFKVNETSMWGFTPRQLLLMKWDVTQPYWGQGRYAKHLVEFWVNFDKWNTQLVEESLRQLVDTGPPKKFEHIIEKGKKITEPVPLIGRGKAGEGTPKDVVADPTADTEEYEIIRERNFLADGIFPTFLPGVIF